MFHNKLKTQTCYEFKYVRSPASQNCNVESSLFKTNLNIQEKIDSSSFVFFH